MSKPRGPKSKAPKPKAVAGNNHGSGAGEMHCAFCGKPESAAQRMIVVGKNKQPICDECIHICTQILDDSGIKSS